MFKMIVLGTMACLLSITSLSYSVSPSEILPDEPDTLTRSLDWQTYFDVNNVLMFLYNTGNVAYDYLSVLGRTDGFYYPFTGDINDILDGTEDRTLVYAAGLWLGGKVGDDIRVAIAEYSSEFYVGPMLDGTYQPDCPEFQVYKIDESSGPGDSDYDGWPFGDGAPSDAFGTPLLIGDQTLWAVFNDAHPDYHGDMLTHPLGVEVQQTVWSSDNILDENALYIKYKLYNKGGNTIDSFYISFWADPDIGDPSDDFVGCDTSDHVFFSYNDGSDLDYGFQPPAWGGKILSGPVAPSPGDTAIFDGHRLPGYRNLGMTAFSKYINGEDPQDYQEVFYMMKGMDRNGDPVINPTTGNETTYYLSGDPVTDEGWVDENSSDRRLIATMGPLTFNPGDSQQVVVKLAASIKDGPVSAISGLRRILNSNWDKAVIEPDEMHRYYVYAVDPIIATIYVGDLSDGYAVSDIDQSTVVINDSIVPTSAEVISSHPEFTGDVLKIAFPVIGFIRGYGSLFDVTEQLFSVSGLFTDSEPLIAAGTVTIVGKKYGDANGDGEIDVDDVVFLLQFVFAGGPAPAPGLLGDNDCSGAIDVDDITYLVEYIFAGGAAPREGCR